MAHRKHNESMQHSAQEFERLYRESFDEVFSHILYRMLDEEAAYDVTSEAFLRASRFFSSYDPARAKFATWVKAIAHNCMIDHYRKVKAYTPIDEVPEAIFATDDDPAQHVSDADLAHRLLAELSADDRELIRMKYYQGMRNSEIAHELDMNPSTVATRIQRALSKMRAAVD